MVIVPKILRNVSLTAHPKGCELSVRNQIDWVRQQLEQHSDTRYQLPHTNFFPKKVLIVGGSTGYGLASRIVAACVGKADTINVSVEREPSETKTATPGWYNTTVFERYAKTHGLKAVSVLKDAYAKTTKAEVASLIAKHFGTIDLLIYSLASPARTDSSGTTYRSVIKPIGNQYGALSVDVTTGMVSKVIVEPADQSQIEETVKVMGGEDWNDWITYLLQCNLLSDGFKTVSYSYIGPELTYPIYRSGTIGKAKEDLENSARLLNETLQSVNGSAYVSVNKALVTRASAVIPVVPLYIALLYRVMKDLNLHEECIHQIYRLFSERLYTGTSIPLDEKGRIRIDDWEMSDSVQQAVHLLWSTQSEGQAIIGGDLEGFITEYAKIHGFGFDEINYSEDIDPRII
ncbi:MAG: enoyl-ACP reductase FabV [Sphaerochaetaceae bacterium]